MFFWHVILLVNQILRPKGLKLNVRFVWSSDGDPRKKIVVAWRAFTGVVSPISIMTAWSSGHG